MPTCQQTMSVTVSGPFTIGPTVVALGDVLPPPRLGARAAPRRAYCASIASISSSVYGASSIVVVLLALARLGALGADHQPVLRRQERAVVVAEHLRRSTRGRPARRTRSACRARRRARCAGATRVPGRSGAHHSRALDASRTRARRAAGRPSCRSRCSSATAVDLVLADQRVAARPAPAGRSGRPSGSSAP